MITDVTVRKLEPDDIDSALSLVWKIFMEFEAPGYSEDGVNEFYKSIHDSGYVSRLVFYGAFVSGEQAGVIATRNGGSHIALFFVDGRFQRQGIGRKLFDAVLTDCTAEKITVNSSPYAVPVYHRFGFTDTDTEQSVNGLRFTPMEYITGIE